MDLLLVNSLAPRQRSISDTALENSLVLLRTHLRRQGFAVEIFDPQRLDALERGVPKLLRLWLRATVRWQLRHGLRNRLLGVLSLLLTQPGQWLAIRLRRRFVRSQLRAIVATVRREGVKTLGIKAWCGESYRFCTDLARAVRRHCPETVVLVGGPQVNVYGRHVLDGTEFDLAVRGPGEPLLARWLARRRAVPGREAFLEEVRRGNGGSSFFLLRDVQGQVDPAEYVKTLSIPEYQAEDLRGKLRFHTVVNAFGCSWGQCHFCAQGPLFHGYTCREAGQVVDELEAMRRRGIRFFRFSSAEVSLPHGREIAEEILRRGIEVRFSAFLRAGDDTAERAADLRQMIRAGLRAVFIGVESGHDGCLASTMHKGVNRAQIAATVPMIRAAAAAAGQTCQIGLSFLYPCPVGDTFSLEEVYASNVQLLAETRPDTAIVNPPGVFPGTVWAREPARFGIEMEPAFLHDLMHYEYAFYKPPEWWPRIGLRIQGRDVREMLAETGRLRRAAADMGIPTDIPDEHLMMAHAIGYDTPEKLRAFKRESLLDIVSGTVTFTRQVAARVAESNAT